MSVVDASVWVSLLATDDVNHEATRQWFDQEIAEGARFTAPSLVLVEVAGAMTRRTGRDASAGVDAAARVRGLAELELVPLAVDAAERAATIAVRYVLRGADAVYVALASELGVQLITWDRQQRERSSAVVRAISPADDRAMRDDLDHQGQGVKTLAPPPTNVLQGGVQPSVTISGTVTAWPMTTWRIVNVNCVVPAVNEEVKSAVMPVPVLFRSMDAFTIGPPGVAKAD